MAAEVGSARRPHRADDLVQGGTGGARRELLLRAAFVVDAAGRGEYPLETSVGGVAGADGGVGVGRLHTEVFRLVSEVARVVVRLDIIGRAGLGYRLLETHLLRPPGLGRQAHTTFTRAHI